MESSMAILWPTRANAEAPRPLEAVRRALGNATTFVDAGAAVLALRPVDAGITDDARAGDEQVPLILAWGIETPAARHIVDALATMGAPESLDGRPRALALPEFWGGEIVTLALADERGVVGDLHLLGRAGFSERRPLAETRIRRAILSELVLAIRQDQEVSRLREQSRQLESILHFSGDGIVTVDAALRITGFNPAMETMTAWRVRNVLGQFYYDVLRPLDRKGSPLGFDRDPLVQALATGRTVADREIVLLARDGQRVDVSVTAAAVRSPQGQPISGVLNVRDITRSLEAEELRSTFVSVVSHELQTPIAIIKAYASTLRRDDTTWDADTLRGGLEAMEDEADRLDHLVGNLLYASRIQAGGLQMDPTAMDLADAVRGAVRRFVARSPEIDVKVRFPVAAPPLLADRERIQEVVLNLLDNAVKYSPRGQRIRVTGKVTDEAFIVSVSDRGQGIPLREQERIFERFQRLEGADVRRTQGAGLGLYICRAIMEAHGGRLWVHSELGQGSTFSFSLPRKERRALPLVIFADDDKPVPENALAASGISAAPGQGTE
jgi:PAS domain S-box-containing protein